jgi:ABC-2 type transport system ATP-binding protein
MEAEKVIEVKDMVKRFGSFVANDNLTFNVYRGEIFGFLGANGAGKTTAIKILCGLSRPSSGKVTVAGIDAGRSPDEIKKRIGYMSQRFSLYDDLTVAENIELYGGIYGLTMKEIRPRMEQLLERLDFRSYRNTLIRDMPLGLRQKLAFSVAVFHNPEIVFLDEPTSGVDPITRRQFWEMIYETAAGGITVFVTTHYMDEAEYCDRITIMNEGKIVALDSPSKLRSDFGVETIEELFVMITRPKNEMI